MDGVQTSQELKKKYPGLLPPIVAMTAYSMKEDRDRFISQGMDDYIAKPIRAQTLVHKVREIIGSSKSIDISKVPAKIDEPSIPVLDREIIEQLSGIGGPELVWSVFEDFVTEATELVDGALEAYKKGDIPTVKSNLHTLKGSGGTVGVAQVAEIAREAELRLKTNDTSTLAEALPRLKAAYGTFLEQYEGLLKDWFHER
jgi:CheY-like chemotaxis protein